MLVADNGITLMGSDALQVGGISYQKGTDISISLGGDNEAELSGYYNKLAVGGKIVQPLTKAPWGDTFGMFWMVNITSKKV
ncbi:MAG: VOC family protein [Patescibacteria group bacterium]